MLPFIGVATGRWLGTEVLDEPPPPGHPPPIVDEAPPPDADELDESEPLKIAASASPTNPIATIAPTESSSLVRDGAA